MSEPAFSNLPRFDDAQDEAPALRLRRMMETASPSRPEPVAPEPVELPIVPPAVVHAMDEEVLAMRAMVSDLARVVGRIEAEARQTSLEIVRAMTAQLFPELSRHFLAEEIVYHLPGLLPAAAPEIVIRATPELADQILQLIRLHPALEGRCVVVPVEGQSGGRAEVSWKTGGVTFDFDALLSACLNHIRTQPSESLEST
jgi:hypothetical protein